jgi:hypothetical protein
MFFEFVVTFKRYKPGVAAAQPTRQTNRTEPRKRADFKHERRRNHTREHLQKPPLHLPSKHFSTKYTDMRTALYLL